MLRNREGFTLIELLIVVVIIGILAAIALPKFGQTRERAYVSAMQSDLRNLQSSQEMYYADNDYNYLQSGTLTTTPTASLSGYATTSGVEIELADGGIAVTDGYEATATHAATDDECVLTVGGTGADEGIVCTSTT